MATDIHTLTGHWLLQLKSSGYKLTGPRFYVIEILAQTQKALTALEIFNLAHRHYPSIGLVSVYRTLEKLEMLGLIQRVHRRERCHAYIAAPVGHEHLLVCNSCGKVSFFHGDDLKTLVNKVERQSGYQVQDHWLQLIGICNDCQHLINTQTKNLQPMS